MDATQWKTQGGLALAVIGLWIAGCSPITSGSVNSHGLNGQICSTRVVPQSFLVSWKGSVPREYEKNRLHPGSLITRFTGIEKERIEQEILKRHLSEYAVAEHEFYIESLEPQAAACSSPTLPMAWATDDLQAQAAWNLLQTQGRNVTVAVIDSGTDINHPLLAGQIWTNPNETLNGRDDDQNGIIDDISGWNFNEESADVSDGANHGTHVAGVIAGLPGANGFVGIAPGAKLMPLKFIDGEGKGSVGDAIAAVNYAVAKGARVINASWGGEFCSDLLKQDITQAALSGTVFVNASGNRGRNLSLFPEWPAAFQIAGKITVGAYNSDQFLSLFSNFGQLVDVAAPGERILSTVPPGPGQPEGQLCDKSGTSMATPYVSGVAALLFSARPSLTAFQVVDAINSTVIQGNFGVRTGGKINALRAAQWLQSH